MGGACCVFICVRSSVAGHLSACVETTGTIVEQSVRVSGYLLFTGRGCIICTDTDIFSESRTYIGM